MKLQLRPRTFGPVRRMLPALFLAATLGSAPAPAQNVNAPPSATAGMPARLRLPADQHLLPGKGVIQKWKRFPQMYDDRRAEFWRHREQDKGAVVFLGDSITQTWKGLAADFPDLKVANRGIGGDITRGVLFRLKVDVEDLKPAAVVLLIGTNDLGNGGKPDDIAANIRLIVAALEKSNPRMPIIVCDVMPRRKSFAARIENLNAQLDAMVRADPRLTRCDTWSIYATKEGACRKAEFPDMLHPNKAGFAKWVKALQPIFARLDLGTKK